MPPTLKLGSYGDAVEASKIALYRWDDEWDAYLKLTKLGRRTFGVFYRGNVKRFQKAKGLLQTGVIGPRTWAKLDPYMTPRAKELLATKPPLVKPLQGWDSLHRSLWEVYSLGRTMGFHDLGTWNPDSRLPGGGLSDHAVYPAMAFDLGIDPDIGWAHMTARAYALSIAGNPAVEYVILGDRIWTREAGWHAYTSGGHLNHLHVSGNR